MNILIWKNILSIIILKYDHPLHIFFFFDKQQRTIFQDINDTQIYP